MKKLSIRGVGFITPHLLGLTLVYLMPFILSLVLSFQKSITRIGTFTFKNYISVIHNDAFQLALKNNLVFMLIGLPLIMLISFALSYAVYAQKPPKWVSLAFILPICIPSAAVIGFFRRLFDYGPNSLLDSDMAMIAVIIIFIWKNMGYNILIFLAGFSNIPTVLYENAEMDGANKLQVLWHIVVPQMTGTAVFAFVVSLLNSYKVFKDIYLLQGAYPNASIYMLQNYMNNKLLKFQIGELTAASNLFMLAILLVIASFFMIDTQSNKKERDLWLSLSADRG